MKLPRILTASQVAREAGVSRATLYAWIDKGLLDPPEFTRSGDVEMRLWTEEDIERVLKLKGSLKLGRPISRKRKRGAR